MENRKSAGIYFDTLPNELQILIINNVELKMNCSLVCWRFYELSYIIGKSKTVLKMNWANKVESVKKVQLLVLIRVLITF